MSSPIASWTRFKRSSGRSRAGVCHQPNSTALRRPPLPWTIPNPHAAVPGSIPRTFTSKGYGPARTVLRRGEERREGRLLAQGVEVGVARRVLAEPLPELDRTAEMADRRVGAPAEALAAGEVVLEPRVLRVRLRQLQGGVGVLGVAPLHVERAD